MQVVGFAVELHQLDIEFVAHRGWTWRQPTKAGGSTVTTLMGAEVQPQQYPTGEAADIRRRGGQWRVSRPAGPRSDRASRRELSTTNRPTALPT